MRENEWAYSDVISDEMRDKYNNNVKLNSDWTIDTSWKGEEEVKEKIEKQAGNVKNIVMAVMLLGAGGLQKANADSLEFSPIWSDKPVPFLNISGVDFKNYDTSAIDKIGSMCDLNHLTGNQNKVYEDTPKEQKCVDTGLDAYDAKYDKKQDEIAERLRKDNERLDAEAERLDAKADRLDAEAERLDAEAERLRKDTANKKVIIDKIDKYL